MSSEWWVVYTFRDLPVVRVQFFSDGAAAAGAAGIG
jgi:hypothetical protein